MTARRESLQHLLSPPQQGFVHELVLCGGVFHPDQTYHLEIPNNYKNQMRNISNQALTVRKEKQLVNTSRGNIA